MILGRRGLMPNPKTGTVTNDLPASLNELRKGRTEYRTDKSGIIHLPVGKVSMEPEKIAENLNTLVEEISRKRPADAKGDFIASIYLTPTMGPSVKVVLNKSEKR
jgi:large subunit ribosomal protein L1